MRLTRFLVFAFCAGLASAYGSRAAMERVVYFLVYQMEDILAIDGVGDSDSFKLAAGCGGGIGGERNGLLKKSKRCSLAQFLDWTWRKTPTTVGGVEYFDTKPDPDTIKWTASKAVMTSSTMDALQMGPYIENARDGSGLKLTRKIDVPKAGGDGTVKIMQHGYTGNVDEANKLWAGSGHPEGFEGYTRSIEKIADRAQELMDHWQTAIDKEIINIVDKDKETYDDHKEAHDRLTKQLDQAKIAAARVVTLRKADQMRAIKTSTKFKEAFGGVQPVWETDADGVWQMKEDETLEKLKKSGKSEAEAKKLYDDTWDEVRAGEKYQSHQAAVAQAEQMSLKFGGIGVPCGPPDT